MLERRDFLQRTLLASGAAAFAAMSAASSASGQEARPAAEKRGVKVFALQKRKAGLTKQRFQDYWRHPHATLASAIGTKEHFVQSHQVDTQHLGPKQTQCDGVAELSFATLGDAAALGSNAVYKARVAPDEPNFLDMKSLRFMVVDEEILMAAPTAENGAKPIDIGWNALQRPVSIKLIQFFDPTVKGWDRNEDLELGRSLGALRHVRSRPNPIAHANPSFKPFASGVRELWWPTLSAFEDGVEASPAAWTALRDRAPSLSFLAQAERWF